jgi:hypothetical protein
MNNPETLTTLGTQIKVKGKRYRKSGVIILNIEYFRISIKYIEGFKCNHVIFVLVSK